MDQLGDSIGKGFQVIALVATLIAASATLLAWSLLLYFGRRRDALRAVGLALVVAIHFLPFAFTLADPSPTETWSLSDQWRGWGAAAAWSLPGLAALIWFAPRFVGESLRSQLFARGAIVAGYGALIATMIHLYQPGMMREPLVQIVTTAREQWACGVTAAGDVFCLGGNHDGQLGASDEPNIERPRKVAELSPSTALFMGRFTTCGLTPPSTVRCVGRWRGAPKQLFTATSALKVAKVLVGEAELAFVSSEGAVEVWSEQGAKLIAANSTKQLLCGSQIVLLGGGRAEMRSTNSGGRIELGDARAIGCEEDGADYRVALLDGARLRYFKASGEPDEDVDVTESATFAPSDARIALRDGNRIARCAAGASLFHRVAVSCEWQETPRKPVRLSGTPEELGDSVTYSAQRLAEMSLELP